MKSCSVSRPNKNDSAFFSDPSVYQSETLCVYISSFLTHRAISLHPPPSAACSPSLIFPLSQHNSGDQSLVAMAIKPPMQVYVCVCVSECACVCACVHVVTTPVYSVLHTLYLPLSSQGDEASTGDAALRDALPFRVALTAVQSRCSHLPHLASFQLCAE